MVHEVAPADALLRLFEQTDDARVLLDADGRVVLVNRSCEELLGWPRDELVGSSKGLLVPDRLREEYTRLRAVLVASDAADAVRLNLWARHRAGHEVPVRITARLIQLGDERLVSLVLHPRHEGEADTGFRELLDALLDGNVIVDGEGLIMMANAQVEELFGYPEDELVDQPVELLVPEALRRPHETHRHGFAGRARRHPMGLGTRVLGRRKDGSTFPVQVLLSSIGTDDGVLVSATIRDLTGIEAMQSDNDRLRSQFLATVSHELRTPLTTIMASAEMLVDGLGEADGPAAREQVAAYAERILRAARRELTLVDDLLALTAIEGAGERIGGGLADVGLVARGVVAEARERASARGLAVELEVPDEPLLVPAHERWLARAVGCVLDNAVKFTPRGGRISVSVTAGDPVVLEVRDNGPGIPAGEEEQVFTRLYRGANAIEAETQGAGLGLTIARSIVVGTGGSLVAVPGSDGARLRMMVPLAASGPADRPPATSSDRS